MGKDTIGDFLLEPFQALSFTDPLECGCGGLQETAFSPGGGDLTTIHRIDGCLSQPPTARSRRFAQEWQRCFVEAQRSRLPGESSETAQGLGQGSSVSSWMPAYPRPVPRYCLPDEAERRRLYGTTQGKRHSDTWGRHNRPLSGGSPICVTYHDILGPRCAVDTR